MKQFIYILTFIILLPQISLSQVDFWAMQGQNCMRTGYSSYPGPITSELNWNYDLGCTLQDNACPIVGPDGTIYVPTDKHFFAFNPNGTQKWKKTHGGRVSWMMRNAPALSPDGSIIYVLSRWLTADTKLNALSTINGDTLWTYKFGRHVSYSSLAVDNNGIVYIGACTPASVYAWNPDGTLKWVYTHPNSDAIGIEAPVAIAPDGSVYCIINTVGLVALDQNGNFKWKKGDNCGDYGWPTPCILPDGTIIITGSWGYWYRKLIAYNPDGTIKWQRADIDWQVGYFPGVAVSRDGSTIFIARSFREHSGGVMYALDAQTGTTNWSSIIDSTKGLDGSPALASNGIIYVMGKGKDVYAILELDGTLLWKYQLNTHAFAWGPQSPAIGPNGSLYVVSSGTIPLEGSIPAHLYSFKYTPNKAPFVSINNPVEGMRFVSGSTIIITATAEDSDGTVQKVEFLLNNIKLGEDSDGLDGFSFQWNDVSCGLYSLTTKAADNYGIKSQSIPIRINVIPPSPVLVSPSDSLTNVPTTLTLTWTSISGKAVYHVQVSTSNTFEEILVQDSTLTSCSKNISGLANNTQYFWRVRANIAGSISDWSSIWSFTTIIAAPDAPSLALPTDGAVNQPTTLSLSWNPSTNAVYYQVQVSRNTTFTNIVFDGSTSTDTSLQVGPLINNRTYYWRVRARNIGGMSSWSPVWSFTTIVQLPNAVSLLTPSNLTVLNCDSVCFVWRQCVPMVTGYWFELATDSLMVNAMIDTTLLATDTTKTVCDLDQQMYWWRVKAKNAAGWGLFSEKRNFSILFTSVHSSVELPSEFRLCQNYPNPFNPGTVIEYGIPKASQVELKVFDLLGRELRVLVDEQQAPGTYQVQFDGQNLPAGLYFYRLRAGEFCETKKMVIVK